jgi:hypothetical protein
LVSAFCGAGTIAGFAFVGSRFQSLEDLSSRLQLPVIASLQPQWQAAA